MTVQTPQGEGVERVVGPPPTDPRSPFGSDGKCGTCGGLGEHFASCAHATWERRVLA